MCAGDLEVEQRLLVIRSLLRERGERVRHFEDGSFAGAVAGDGDVDVAPCAGNRGAGVVGTADRGKRFVVRGDELLLDPAARDDELILRRLRFQFGLPLFRAADAPIEDAAVELGGGERTPMTAGSPAG